MPIDNIAATNHDMTLFTSVAIVNDTKCCSTITLTLFERSAHQTIERRKSD
jgi:hypothetical protein